MQLHLNRGVWRGKRLLSEQVWKEMHTVQYRKEIESAHAHGKTPAFEPFGLGPLLRGTKRTYSLPTSTLERFEASVASGSRSALIADLIDERLQDQERERLRRDIIEGCQVMADVMRESTKQSELTTGLKSI